MTKGNNDDACRAKRRLDLATKTATKEDVIVNNPYKKPKVNVDKKPKSTSSITDVVTSATATTVITPETGIEKFFVKDKKEFAKNLSVKRKLLDTSSGTEDVDGLYYHSDNSDEESKKNKGTENHPDHIHVNIDYHHRGEITLTTGQMSAYRFIRNHFLIPRNIELDPDFGPWSGICFEERVLRAYALGQLLPKKPKRDDGASLIVCLYCGEEGHKKDGCLKLI
jgi:hypothetical protein